MKKLLLALMLLVTFAGTLSANGDPSAAPETAAANPDTLDIVGLFERRDTVTYVIEKERWKINGNDTVVTPGPSCKVRITVADSTARGYRLDYTFLEFLPDNTPMSAATVARRIITAKLTRDLVGKTISFQTDDVGCITGPIDAGEILKQAKDLSNSVSGDFGKIGQVLGLAPKEFEDFVGEVSAGMVESYIGDIKLLFKHYGECFPMGDYSEHEEAGSTAYENETLRSVYVNENGIGCLTYTVVNYLPPEKMKDLVYSFIDKEPGDKSAEQEMEKLDKNLAEGGIYQFEYIGMYIPYSWPYAVIDKVTTAVGELSDVKRTLIYLDSYKTRR